MSFYPRIKKYMLCETIPKKYQTKETKKLQHCQVQKMSKITDVRVTWSGVLLCAHMTSGRCTGCDCDLKHSMYKNYKGYWQKRRCTSHPLWKKLCPAKMKLTDTFPAGLNSDEGMNTLKMVWQQAVASL